jgi:putative LysE/RhtB family amino acid efflux pump
VTALATGFGLGFLVALQLGPMSLFLIRSTLRSGVRVGLAIGAGIAGVDALYAAAGAAGAAPLLSFEPVRVALGLVGAGVLLWLGLRTLGQAVRVRAGLDGPADVDTPGRAFVTSLGTTASNPATIVSWAALFSAASVGTGAGAVPLVAGVALGSLTWVTALACGVGTVRRSATPRVVRVVDGVAGAGLIGFAGVLGWRSASS